MARRLAPVLLLCCVAAALYAAADPDDDELAAAHRRFRQWRRHPDKLARLRQHWQSFQELPAARREQVLQFDRELHEEPSAVQAQLWNVLERYQDWYNRLPEADQKALQAARDKRERLELIQEVRDRQWMKEQPRALRDEWDKLKGAARKDLVKRLRAEERQRQQEWQIAARFWKELETHQLLPASQSALPPEVQVYVSEYLLPLLEPAEKERLKQAEGSWPGYMLTLVALADRHPPALQGKTGPRHFADLPQAVRQRFGKKGENLPGALKQAEGKWPDFAVAVVELARKRPDLPLPHELWPRNFQGLQPAMQQFVETTLKPALDIDEKTTLLHSEGRWPDYPDKIQELAQAHYLHPPWYTLPPPPLRSGASWEPDAYRLQRERTVQGYPELPAQRLRQFALYEIDPAERARLNLSTADPRSWQRLTEAYFKQHPHELKKYRQLDSRKGPRADRPAP